MTDNEDVILENYCDDHHGYMILQVTSDTISGQYFMVPKPTENWGVMSQKIDSFVLDLKQHKLTKNTNPHDLMLVTYKSGVEIYWA